MLIPENFIDFLYWFKNVTEAAWAKKEHKERKTDEVLLNAKWVGMKDHQIDEVEKKYQIKFPEDHREFLRILHTVNIKPSQDYDFFFNWLEDEKYVVYKLNWPHLTILNDMIWLDSWGKKPNADEAIKKRFDDWYHEAPKLIPVFGHRYMLSSPHRVNNPILSVWGSDTILYGWNLKEYLLKEFTERLPIELFDRRYEEEGNYWEYQFKDKIQEIFDKKWWDPSLKKYDNIPFWGEIIKYNLGMFPVNTA